MASLADHLARHRQADLFLDTLPYNAHSTAIDALRAGLPVVTCPGCTFAGRVGASLLQAVGLPELIARDLDEYAALATKLATDRACLQSIRDKLAENNKSSPLFDPERLCRRIEAAYATMWDTYLRGEPPRSFRVEPNWSSRRSRCIARAACSKRRRSTVPCWPVDPGILRRRTCWACSKCSRARRRRPCR